MLARSVCEWSRRASKAMLQPRRYSAFFLVSLLALLPAGVAAQTGSVTGQVVSEGGLSPLSGVQILIEGTGIGGITNNAGRFLLLNVPAGNVVVTATMLGRRSVQETTTVTAGSSVVVNFRLVEMAVSLDELVVTGTAGAQLARSLGTTVGRIQVAQTQELTPVTTMDNMLSGAVPGVNVAAGGGAVGGGSNIRIRGAGSIVLSGQPLLYIDGVRANRGGAGEDVTLGTGNSRPASRLNDINPEIIESIEIIKGPAAATLYGTEASNGVINIITKKGAQGAPVFTLTQKFGQNWYQDPRTHWSGAYFTCTGTGTHGCTVGETVGPINVFMEDYLSLGLIHFRNGMPLGTTGTVSGGTDELRYHFTLGWDRDEGPVPNNDQTTFNARANLNWLPREDLTVDFGIGVVRSELNTTTGRQPARITGFNWACPSNGCERGTGNPAALDGPLRGYIAYLPDLYDKFLSSGQNVNRGIYTFTATHRPTEWFTHRLVLGMDQVETEGFRVNRHTSGLIGISSRTGSKNVEYRDTENLSFDYSGTATLDPVADLTLATSAGVQYFEKSSKWLTGQGSVFAVPSLSTISASTRQSTSDGAAANKTVGMYVQEQISWQNRWFLTGAVRGDDNSAFGADYDFVLYPKLSASWVVSDESFMQGVGLFDELRLRAAWGRAGQQPDQFAAVRLYDPEPGFQGAGGLTPATIGNPEVEPEVGEEIEVGFDAGLFSERVGLQVTYYNQKRKNALIAIPVKPSTGFPGTQLQNIGEIQNQGLEIGLNWDALTGGSVGVAFNTSVHFNRNEVTDLGGLDPIPVFGQNASTGWTGQRHVEGFPLGSIFEARVVSADIVGTGFGVARAVNVMCESGPIAWPGTNITRGGGPAVPCDASNAPEVYRGGTIPTREVSFNATVTLFRNTRVFADFDYAGGHHMVDGITAAAHYFFKNTKAIHDATDPILLGYVGLGALGSNQPGLFDASQIVLRNLAVSHTFGESVAAKVGASRLNLTVSSENLWHVWRATTEVFGRKIADSEIRTTGGTATDPGGISAYTQDGFPLFKRFLVTMRVTF